MKISRFEKNKKIEDNIIKNVRNLFRLKRKIDDTTIKDVKNLFRLKKVIDDTTIKNFRNLFRLKNENEAIKDRIFTDIRNLFEHEEEDYYKRVRIGDFCSKNYIEYESNSDRNKTLSVEEYLNKIRSYLKNIINHHKKSNT